jgi:glycosyltransferase involved in cell wall biosynthesis
VLLVSSFVLPHSGGVEQFVETVRTVLTQRGCRVRVLACGLPGADDGADVVVPARHLGAAGWPLPVGGWRAVARELRRSDVVIANNARHVLPVVAVLAGRAARRRAVLVVHGSGAADDGGPRALRAARALFRRTLGRAAIRAGVPVSVSRAGVDGIRREYGADARYLPYPLRPLPPAAVVPPPGPAEPLRVVWVGRLAREKDPLLAVAAVEVLRRSRPATLDVIGDGPLAPELRGAAAARPWLRVRGERPWAEVMAAQAAAHVCLSTSAWDNVQVALLETLARGIPAVATAVGDAPRHFADPALRDCCVPPGNAIALAGALERLAGDLPAARAAFGRNAARLWALHAEAPRVLAELVTR